MRCGEPALDQYLKTQASQDERRNFATAFVAVAKDTSAVAGFYTLSAAAVTLDRVPEKLRQKWPRYPMVPAVRLGRLAVATAAQGRGLGSLLLVDAIRRALDTDVAWAAFVVDAKTDRARKFYQNHGFQSFLDDPNHLFLPRETAEQLFE